LPRHPGTRGRLALGQPRPGQCSPLPRGLQCRHGRVPPNLEATQRCGDVMSSPAIVTEHLTKTYGANRGIRDINLTINQGEIFGFLGPNGAGKSTTMRTLLGFMRPTSGSARIFGHDIVTASVALRHHLGNLPRELTR